MTPHPEPIPPERPMHALDESYCDLCSTRCEADDFCPEAELFLCPDCIETLVEQAIQ